MLSILPLLRQLRAIYRQLTSVRKSLKLAVVITDPPQGGSLPIFILGKCKPLPGQLSRVHVRVAHRQIVELHALVITVEAEGI